MSEVRKGTSRNTENENKRRKFNTLSLVDCYVQICNGTAVEYGSLLNCSGVCDGINCCKSVIITK
jgi:heme A synthase